MTLKINVDIKNVIGEKAFLALVKYWGGLNLYVPMYVNVYNPHHKKLMDILGEDNYLALIRYAAGTMIYVPTVSTVNQLKRNKKILEKFAKLKRKKVSTLQATQMIAKQYKLSQRQIYNIVRKVLCKAPHIA